MGGGPHVSFIPSRLFERSQLELVRDTVRDTICFSLKLLTSSSVASLPMSFWPTSRKVSEPLTRTPQRWRKR